MQRKVDKDDGADRIQRTEDKSKIHFKRCGKSGHECYKSCYQATNLTKLFLRKQRNGSHIYCETLQVPEAPSAKKEIPEAAQVFHHEQQEAPPPQRGQNGRRQA